MTYKLHGFFLFNSYLWFFAFYCFHYTILSKNQSPFCFDFIAFHCMKVLHLKYHIKFIFITASLELSIEWILYLLLLDLLMVWDNWMTKRAFWVCRGFLILISTVLLDLGSTQYLMACGKNTSEDIFLN